MNLYAYAGNNPIGFSDPFGLCPPVDNDPCNTATGDPNIDNIAIRQQWETSYKTAPTDAAHPGYAVEVGGWCKVETASCTRVSGDVAHVKLGKAHGADLAYHTHGNAGKQAIGQPDGVNYEPYPSDQDIGNQGGRKQPSYIIGPNTIYRTDRVGKDGAGNQQVGWACYNRWNNINACPQ